MLKQTLSNSTENTGISRPNKTSLLLSNAKSILSMQVVNTQQRRLSSRSHEGILNYIVKFSAYFITSALAQRPIKPSESNTLQIKCRKLRHVTLTQTVLQRAVLEREGCIPSIKMLNYPLTCCENAHLAKCMMQASGINETTYTFHTHKKKKTFISLFWFSLHTTGRQHCSVFKNTESGDKVRMKLS